MTVMGAFPVKQPETLASKKCVMVSIPATNEAETYCTGALSVLAIPISVVKFKCNGKCCIYGRRLYT